MHSRLRCLASQSQNRSLTRPRNQFPNHFRKFKPTQGGRLASSSHSFQSSATVRQQSRRRGRPASTYNFHTTFKSPQSTAISSLLDSTDGDDDIANAPESHPHPPSPSNHNDLPIDLPPLPEDIFYTSNSESPVDVCDDLDNDPFSSHLDRELGLDSKWDRAFDQGEIDDFTIDEIQDDVDDLEDIEELVMISEESYEMPTDPISMTKPLQEDSAASIVPATPEQRHSAISPPSSSRTFEDSPISVMEMLRNFDPDRPPTSGNAEELQLWLECFAQREAVTRHQQLVEKARDRKAFDSMSLMQRHIVQWFQGLRDAIEVRQKEYISNTDKRRASTRYGPFLCSLHPEKMAVIVSQEAITQALTCCGRDGSNGITLVKMALAIGRAVETEVVSQRRIKERYRNAYSSALEQADTADDDNDDKQEVGDADVGEVTSDKEPSEGDKEFPVDRWAFSASHLKLFWDDLKRLGMGKNKRSVQYAMRRAKQAMNSKDTWTDDDLTQVGAALLSILIEKAKINDFGKVEPAFRVEKRWKHGTNSRKSISYVTIHDRLYKIFLEDEYMSWAANTTRHLPMIVPPSKWTEPKKGGYRWLEVNLMRTHGSNVQKEALEQADLTSVCDGLDILGKTAWRINKEILEVGQRCWRENIAIGDIPSRTDFELPPEPVRPTFASEEIYDKLDADHQRRIAMMKEYRDSIAKRQRIHQKNMDLRSLRCSAMLKLNQANKFKDMERIYFPYNLDFRGRAYPIPPHLSNVGSDLCRGVLTFADAKPLGKRGLFWLKVHLANFAGKDKMSFEARAEYIDNNMDNVRASVSDPFSDNAWWMTLDDPFQGLATCHEIVRAIDSGDPESYECCLPVHMDGSCNGLQHYAALGRDTVGGKAVNLLESDGPQDVYVGVMHEVIRRVAEEAARELDFDTSDPDSLNSKERKALKYNKAAKLVNGLIDRGVVKRTVMTSVYGVTYVGARQQIQEKIEQKLEEKGFDVDEMDRELFAAAGYLATVTMDVMGDLFQGAKRTKTWLADCARLISREGHPVAWISPIGVPAIQPYRQRRPRTVVTVMQSVTVVDENDDLQVHTSRQCTAFPPNYVHSLDSSHMLMTAMEMDRRGLAFSAVHDSFWTHACDVDEMNEALRDCFVELYSKPLLKDLKESWELRYPDVEFPPLPELGNLDLSEVKSATYFFQ
ncbi:DNA-directed RNA polymerase [Nitzschia inconspicua]|uniref:DNA-directed RNA polymerase n=1 Tax=Nitzschia inconspicua TaxID=303405 RepID=A0A9K3LFL9_9STRA|nr:DNA-directed RNA polymerase [Nitzschia inconspicua]KAG7361222.1 DNA-directed RNA polymerase [Nitzschia inconspicua]